MLRGDTATTAFQGYWPSTRPVQARTRVRGSDLPLEGTSGPSWSSTWRTRWGSAFIYGELASGRPIVTNLRLPGQYDERLFLTAGMKLSGPYYNWNRWYLPSLGRYLEADPVALDGEFNADYGADWYNYANGNPAGDTDPFGLFTRDITCLNLPNEGDVIKAADAVTDVNLKQCILTQNEHAHMKCPDQPDPQCCDSPKAFNACAGGPGTCKVTWCNRVKKKCAADVVVHEFAHNCGWNHKGGKGVPHQDGVAPGGCSL